MNVVVESQGMWETPAASASSKETSSDETSTCVRHGPPEQRGIDCLDAEVNADCRRLRDYLSVPVPLPDPNFCRGFRVSEILDLDAVLNVVLSNA